MLKLLNIHVCAIIIRDIKFMGPYSSFFFLNFLQANGINVIDWPDTRAVREVRGIWS